MSFVFVDRLYIKHQMAKINKNWSGKLQYGVTKVSTAAWKS